MTNVAAMRFLSSHQPKEEIMKLRHTLLIMIVQLSGSYVWAVDPPMYSEFKEKVQLNLPGAYSGIDIMYNAYFPNDTAGEVPEEELLTLNKSHVYYDCAKVLHDFAEEWYGTSYLPGMVQYQNKCAQIFHEFYTRKGPGFAGYIRFPHGLAYLFRDTGNQYYSDALIALANKTNWRTINPANEYIAYSREVAYAIDVYIATAKEGIPVADNTAKLEHFVDMALSHLNQWHIATFWKTDTIYKDYRQAFMVGITLNSLIEYYDRVYADPRIPLAVKYTIDDLWSQQWQGNVRNPEPTDGYYGAYHAGYGAFWYWADWNGTEWVNNLNKMSTSLDLNADTNMMIGSVYAWYANYSNDESYMDKAVDIWKGWVANGYFGQSDILWQGARYVNVFLKEYRKFYETPCSSTAIEQCSTSQDCSAAGGNWTGERCQHAPVATSTPSTDSCGTDGLIFSWHAEGLSLESDEESGCSLLGDTTFTAINSPSLSVNDKSEGMSSVFSSQGNYYSLDILENSPTDRGTIEFDARIESDGSYYPLVRLDRNSSNYISVEQAGTSPNVSIMSSAKGGGTTWGDAVAVTHITSGNGAWYRIKYQWNSSGDTYKQKMEVWLLTSTNPRDISSQSTIATGTKTGPIPPFTFIPTKLYIGIAKPTINTSIKNYIDNIKIYNTSDI
jgi:hypothetical protein